MRFPWPHYRRVDTPCSREQQQALKTLDASALEIETLGGDPLRQRLNAAPGNHAPIGGIKLTTDNGWIALRPSGTEPLYKLYAESFLGPDHLQQLILQGQTLKGALGSDP